MKVVEVTTSDRKTRYYLADDTGAPVEPVLMYLKFKDDAGYARNTLRMHCIHLKHYFTFLQETCRDYERATVDTLARFIGWLKNPDIGKRIIPLRLEPAHKAQTINANVDTVIAFYRYLLMHEGMENHLSEKLVKFMNSPSKSYRSFLYGIAPDKPVQSHMLRMPVPRQVIKTVTKEDAVTLLRATTNIRDIRRFTQTLADFFVINDTAGCTGCGRAEFATLIFAAKLSAYICFSAGISAYAVIEGLSIST